MVQLFLNLFKSIRPRQTLKNLSLFAPLIFSGFLLDGKKFSATISALIAFTLLTSSIYLINDVFDLPKDRLHPLKKKRPIAAGELPIPIAIFAATIGVFLSLSLGYQQNFFFFLAEFSYLILQIAYTLFLKNIIVLDVISIAAGFILRVYAGALAINVHMNVWFLLCVVSLSLFLAAGKRRAELTIIDQQTTGSSRKTLSFYTPDLLDAYLSMFANSTWLVYALFTFFAPPPITKPLPFLANLPMALAGINKWLMISIPVVIYGVMRYLNIIYQGARAESPEKVFLEDKPLLATVFIWGIIVVFILYSVHP